MAGYRRPTTPEARERAAEAAQQKLEALHGQLAEQVAKLSSGTEWKVWLNLATHFHSYSMNNVLLIAAQRPDATRVAGYRAWQALGRQVGKGEKGIQVLAPVTRRRADDPADDNLSASGAGSDQGGAATSAKERIVGWRVAYVWDVSQTSGDPLPEQPAIPLLHGEAPAGLWDGLAHQVAAAGFRLERGDSGPADGYTYFGEDRHVRIIGAVDDAHAALTLAHELAHITLHDPGRQDLTTLHCRGTNEVEAESVAYLVAASAGLPSGDNSFGYVTSWASQTGSAGAADPAAVVQATGRRVLAAAHTIITRAGLDSALHTGTVAPGLAERVTANTAATTALRQSADAVNQSLGDRGPDPRRLLELHAAASFWYRAQLLDDTTGQQPRTYLEQRGLGWVVDHEVAAAWQVGYAPGRWTGLLDHLKTLDRGYTDAELEISGLAVRTRKDILVDRFRERIMLPVRDEGGDVVAFIGRAPDTRDPNTPKYLNSPTTPLYTKGEHLYGVGYQPLEGRRVALVEGPLDVLAVHGSVPGIAAVAPSGTAFTNEQAQLLTRHQPAELVVALDGDAGGRAAAVRSYAILRAAGVENAMAAPMPDGEDPASLAETRPAELASRLSDPTHVHPLVDLVVDDKLAEWTGRLDTVENRLLATRDVAAVIAALPIDDGGRLVARAARTLDVLPSDLRVAVADADYVMHIDPWGRPLGLTESAPASPVRIAQAAFSGRPTPQTTGEGARRPRKPAAAARPVAHR